MSDQREKWASVSDDGTTRIWYVDYGDDGIAGITREAFHDLATRAGMRLTMDAVDEAES